MGGGRGEARGRRRRARERRGGREKEKRREKSKWLTTAKLARKRFPPALKEPSSPKPVSRPRLGFGARLVNHIGVTKCNGPQMVQTSRALLKPT